MSEIDGVSIPGYRIVSRIMAGGMATVYVAEQLKLGSRRVAIKIFRQQNPDHTKARYKRFAQEALIARNLQHPHIVQIFDYGSTDEFQFLVMEYLEHGDLKQHIRQGLQPLQALNILQQVAKALALLHQSGIVHRDIKPANILFREPDHAVLADFGIARSIDQNTQLTNTGFVLGTPSYMSPEQINGGGINAKTDMYALGVLFYEMLTGKLPYRGDSVQSVATQHLMAPVPPLPLEVRKLQPLLNRLMAKKAADRMASGSELLQALEHIDRSRGFAVKPPTFVQIHARKIVAVAALMLCSVAVTWAGISQLPHWLDVAAVDNASSLQLAPSKPAVAEVPIPTVAPVAPGIPVVNKAATESSAVVATASNSVKSTISVEQKVREPRSGSKKPVTASPAVKEAAPVKATVAEEVQSVSAEDNVKQENNASVIAEQHATYVAEAAQTAVEAAQAPPPPSAPSMEQPAPSPVASPTPAEKKKLPLVISYF